MYIMAINEEVYIFKPQTVFSAFSVNNLATAKQFYTEALGLEQISNTMGLTLKLPSGGTHFIYAKDDYSPADFTVLNFFVGNIDEVVDTLHRHCIVFESYDNMPAPQGDKGILRGLSTGDGPGKAWFKIQQVILSRCCRKNRILVSTSLESYLDVCGCSSG